MNHSGFKTLFLPIIAILVSSAWFSEAQAENIDCSKAKSLAECRRVCDPYEPPEIDFTPPFSTFEKRYDDCLKKAYSTYRFPKFWFSDYKQRDRFRAMFLKNLLDPAVSESRFSSCEGKDVPMPALIEIWEFGMLKRIIGISSHKWIDYEMPQNNHDDYLYLGTVSGNKSTYYSEVIVASGSIYSEPMNIYEPPSLKTVDISPDSPFDLTWYPNELDERIYQLIQTLMVPSNNLNMRSAFGQVVWSGFDNGRSMLNAFSLSSPKANVRLDNTALYQYDDRGLINKITKYALNYQTQSFAEKDKACLLFDEIGRMKQFDNCIDSSDASYRVIQMDYIDNNYCPASVTVNHQLLYQFEYDQNNRIIRRYDKSDNTQRELRFYYQTHDNYSWDINHLKFTYAQPLKSAPKEIPQAPDNMKLFDPKDYHEMNYYEEDSHGFGEKHLNLARPFLMDLRPVTQGEFEKLMGKNPSFFKDGYRNPAAQAIGKYNILFADPRELPVESVTWFDALAYANARSKSEGLEACYVLDKCEMEDGWYVCRNVRFKGLDCKGYRLPTWEEAKITVSDTPEIDGRAVANNCIPFDNQGCLSTFSVETAKRDEKGLFDRSGNIYEWVWDWYGPEIENYCLGNCENDPKMIKNQLNSLGPATGICRRISGSSFISSSVKTSHEMQCYPPNRGGMQLGFRLVRTAK